MVEAEKNNPAVTMPKGEEIQAASLKKSEEIDTKLAKRGTGERPGGVRRAWLRRRRVARPGCGPQPPPPRVTGAQGRLRTRRRSTFPRSGIGSTWLDLTSGSVERRGKPIFRFTTFPILWKAHSTMAQQDAMEQVKEVVRQLIKYRFWISIGVAALFGLIAYFVGSGPVREGRRKGDDQNQECREGGQDILRADDPHQGVLSQSSTRRPRS